MISYAVRDVSSFYIIFFFIHTNGIGKVVQVCLGDVPDAKSAQQWNDPFHAIEIVHRSMDSSRSPIRIRTQFAAIE